MNAEQRIEELKKMGIDKGAIVKGLNSGETVEIIGELKAVNNYEESEDVIVVSEVSSVKFPEAPTATGFIIWWDQLEVKIIKEAVK